MKCLVVLITLVTITGASHGSDFLFESASLGETGQGGGFSVSGPMGGNTAQFLGVRFHLNETILVDNIGGHLSGNGSLFGAITPLSSFNAFPAGDPLSFVPLAQVTFTPTELSTDIRVPLSVTLNGGDYALIFGSGRFGATGFGSMANNNIDSASANYFQGDSGFWQNSSQVQNVRFVITGTVVPEPSVTALLGIVLGVLVTHLCRRIR
jgi:hypothetical protein